ncbi:MAG TPA: hypothetical protein VI959_01790 [Alphaproteobacteria bacterium]|nr:hypothetical protein [Alphaproteobacteria bacterium]
MYSFLLENVFSTENRPTWGDLVSGLAKLGFKGKPNDIGNGSVWEFSVTYKNELFMENREYAYATFNVHKYPNGNEPINPKYLKFFQSGFSNVFGLTEEYLKRAVNSMKEA